jgi:mannose/cellobiose epimerase-like protein (N-acyl-D-glucosamine 2-epimerase family)
MEGWTLSIHDGSGFMTTFKHERTMTATQKALLLAAVLIFPTGLFAQYNPSDPYLLNPSLSIGYVDSCAKFWEGTWDVADGGFYKDVAREGYQTSEWKSMLTQSRHAYGFVRAFQMTDSLRYLDTARVALEWMIEHAWDDTNGGWFWNIDPDGNIYDTNSEKTAFYQHYALLGLAAYVEATRDSSMMDWLVRGYEWIEQHMWDDRSGFEGYYDAVDASGDNPRNKSFNATVDAVTTHLLLLQLMGVDSLAGHAIEDRLIQVGDQMVNRLVGEMGSNAIGFAEHFDSNWLVDSGETMTLMGHVLKTGWCLARIQQILPDPAWLPASETAVTDVWENGYDHTYGGPYKDFDRVTGDEITWGQAPGVKAWWQMEQAITAGLQLYSMTGDSRWLRMADSTTTFFMRHFVDRDYGEVFADRTRTGGFAWNENKGSGGKAGYHSIETGYYLYLYGGLLLTGDPVILRYRIDPADSARVLKMMPIAMNSDYLLLSDVRLDGEPYTGYDADGHTLDIPANTGGTFAVTYISTHPVSVDPEIVVSLPKRPTLHTPWPNPFNATAQISYKLDRTQFVELTVYDMLGREVRTLTKGTQHSGLHRVSFQAGSLPSGVYLVRLNTPSGTATQRMVLVR